MNNPMNMSAQEPLQTSKIDGINVPLAATSLDPVIAVCASKLLGGQASESSVDDALLEMAKIPGLHHALLFRIESYHAEDLRGRWLGCTDPIDCPACTERRDGDWLRLIDDQIRDELQLGQQLSVAIDHLPAEFQGSFHERKIQSLVFLPLLVLGNWWGGLVLESRQTIHQWSTAATGELETLAAIFSAFFERQVAGEGYQERDKLSGALEMAGTVCHKLNQPMQVILGYASMVTSGDISEFEQIKDVVKLIEDETRQMGIITKNLMGITKNKGAE